MDSTDGISSAVATGETGGTITGHIYTEDGVTPVPGVEVRAYKTDYSDYPGTTAITSTDGSYTITGLETNQYYVVAEKDGYLHRFYGGVYDDFNSDIVYIRAPEIITGVDINLETGGTISGHVYQADGVTPVEGAKVHAEIHGTNSRNGALTDESGSYTISYLSSGNYIVDVRADGFVPEYYGGDSYVAATVVNVSSPGDTGDIDFTLDPAGMISGHIFMEDGSTPLSGVSVYAYAVEDHPVFPAYLSSYSAWFSESDGYYEIENIPPGDYYLRAEKNGYVRKFYNDVIRWSESIPVHVDASATTPDIDFTMSQGGTISGHVYRADDTTPVEGVRIWASPCESSLAGNSGTTDADGWYSISGITSAFYRLQSYKTYDVYIPEYYGGGYSWDQALYVKGHETGDIDNIDFYLDVGGTIAGHIYREDGVTPVSGANIQAIALGTTGNPCNVYSDTDGSYTIAQIPSGAYKVRVDAAGYVVEYYGESHISTSYTPVQVTAPDGVSGIDIVLDLGGSISGHVYQADGVTPICGAELELYSTDGSFEYWHTVQTDQTGSYSVSGVPSGTHYLQAAATGFIPEYYGDASDESEAVAITIQMQESTPDIDFTLDAGGTISGRVYEPDGVTPLYWAEVGVYTADGTFVSSVTNENTGEYTSYGLPDGTYAVKAEVPLYYSQWYDGAESRELAIPISVSLSSSAAGIDFVLEKQVILGDANGDGLVNVLDITRIAWIILDMAPPVPEADVNGDSAVNIYDITEICRMILGMPPYDR